MAFTRSQATSLLSQAEMGLFDDSRANALRGLSETELGKRIERARKARDRARDLLQRQKLASRSRTGSKRGVSGQANQRSKRKAELLAEILGRFEGQTTKAIACMSTADLQDLDLIHHPIPGRFAVQVEGEQAYLDYETADSTMHITHTLVPEAIAGRGIAGRLVQAALNHARHEGWKVKPVCSYADAWMDRHPQYADLRA